MLDKQRSHLNKKVKNYARKKKIKLLYVPSGLTYKYQPLDVSINGIFKNKAIKMYSDFKSTYPDKKYTCKQCIIDVIKIKKSFKIKTIKNAFDCLTIND